MRELNDAVGKGRAELEAQTHRNTGSGRGSLREGPGRDQQEREEEGRRTMTHAPYVLLAARIRCQYKGTPPFSKAGWRIVFPSPPRLYIEPLMPKWRNWQTRWTQNPVWLTPGEGSSPSFGTKRRRLSRNNVLTAHDRQPSTTSGTDRCRTHAERHFTGRTAHPHPSLGALLREHADQREGQTFLIAYTDDGQRREYTYPELYEQVSRAAGVLRSHGVRRGDRVAILSFNTADVVVQYFAAWMIGAVVVPINAGEDDRRVSYVLSSSGASVVFVLDEQLRRLLEMRKDIPGLATVIQVGQRVAADLPHYQSEIAKDSPNGSSPTRNPGRTTTP